MGSRGMPPNKMGPDQDVKGDSPMAKLMAQIQSCLLQVALFAALFSSTIGQRLAFKTMGYQLGPYPLFVLVSISSVFVAVFGAICVAIVVTTGGFQPETRTWRCFWAFAAIGVCNGLQGMGMIFANPSVPGSMQVVLQQAVVPFTLVIAKVVCKPEFSEWQYAGVLCIMGGIAVQLVPALDDKTGASSMPAMALFLFAQVPIAMAAVLQEQVFSGVPVNVFHMMFWASFWQLAVQVVVIPLGVPSLGDLVYQFTDASSVCKQDPAAVGSLVLCVAMMLLAQLSQVLAVKHVSAAFMVLVLSLAVPASAVAFSVPLLMGAHAESLQLSALAALVLVFTGIVCYRAGDMGDALQDHFDGVDFPMAEDAPTITREETSSFLSSGMQTPMDDTSRAGTVSSVDSMEPVWAPKVCMAGVGLISCEYVNWDRHQTSLWRESTLQDMPVLSRSASSRFSSKEVCSSRFGSKDPHGSGGGDRRGSGGDRRGSGGGRRGSLQVRLASKTSSVRMPSKFSVWGDSRAASKVAGSRAASKAIAEADYISEGDYVSEANYVSLADC